MAVWIDALMMLLVLADLVLLGSSRISFCIRIVAFQGIVLGGLPLLRHAPDLGVRPLLLAATALMVKGVVFPRLLLKALRDANIRHEIEPFVGYTSSIVFGVVALGVFLALGRRLEMPLPAPSGLVVPASFFTGLVGLFLIMTRKKALTQVLGYLVMENGIYAFGAVLAIEQPWLVEMGVLLDVFVAVFVMGIIIFHISREFDHVDTHRLAFLRDWRKSYKPVLMKGKKNLEGEFEE
ncbi:hydrogenase [candidate division FCPU426 bacterium]|nr:hydrogenase [candidate division FCPU426 bacterium]